MTRLDQIRHANGVSRELPKFLREPGQRDYGKPPAPISEAQLQSLLNNRMPDSPRSWGSLDVLKILVAGMVLGMVFTLMAQGVMP